ncbi:MFS transporter [Rhodococcus sp. 06-156-3C]|uniref:MFS transporter n=1 Tax=Nocardiaceae TaxID=85025 RepID=UPI0009B80AC8|nr:MULTISPECIES: MFS transporter [Rhodococcus]OZD11649.1 MFS transporter [Rhodococcus sp. 06-156-4C]OZD15491.1 MFS transporter [Rhodococcus sp. 06-156-4a]OZD23657.1 MFS transporter [Rhodococcus sp. 06-156-3C]OZD27271.1 MFS transporter [Rhodococcus sp. 06-156-3b]OZD31333.1 MFS transporter [Rhodococcus sp. 06-156-3]
MNDETVKSRGTSQQPRHVKTPRKAAASGWVGSVLEYYDFFIYAQAAALVFPTLFFPGSNPTVAIVASFATYGVGYVARPIGGFVLGQWGDRHGRKNVLVLCMLIIGVATFGVGLIPSYAAIGVWAPTLLVVLRLVQGFAVGGEIAGASAMIMEHAPFGKRGYYTSFTMQGVAVGQVLAAAAFLPMAMWLPEEAFQSWGWRIPFLLSAVVVFAGIVIRRRVRETPAFLEEQDADKTAPSPVVEAVRNNGADMVRVFVLMLMTIIPVVMLVFGATFATNKAYGNGFAPANLLWLSLIGNAVAALLVPVAGALSDRYGRRPCLIFGMLSSTALCFFYLYAISVHNVVLMFVFGLLAYGVTFQGFQGVFPSALQEQFPTRTRVTGFAIPQNIAGMATALMTTVFALIAPPGANVPVIVGSVVFGIGVAAAVTTYFMRETYRVRMDDLGHRDAQEVSGEEYERIRSTA